MRRSIGKLAAVAVVLAAAVALGDGGVLQRLGSIRNALADPRLVPGVSRCTSDGLCTVVDADGVRAGTPLQLVDR